MCRESACGFVCTISAEISIVSVNSGSVIFSLDSLWHILLVRSIAFHELGCKMTWPKAKYANWISAQKRVDQDLPLSVHILSRFKHPNAENLGRKIGGERWKRNFLHISWEERTRLTRP